MPYKDIEVKKAYQKEYHAKWYQKNKEKRNIQIKEYEKTKPLEWRKSIGQKFHLKTRYGISKEEYLKKLEHQNYKCAICNKDCSENIRNGKVIALSVDHHHITKKVRDLLCHKCNSALGLFQDNSDIIIKASQYLIKHQ